MPGSAVADDIHVDAGTGSREFWHYHTAARVMDGVNQKIAELCNKNFIADDMLKGWMPWFQENHPDRYEKWQAAWLGINDVGDGRTDVEAQKKFNAHLRAYRDGALWCMEEYIKFRKVRMAAELEQSRNKGRQEGLGI